MKIIHDFPNEKNNNSAFDHYQNCYYFAIENFLTELD